MPLIWLMDSNGRWLMNRGEGGGDDGRRETERRGIAIVKGRDRGGVNYCRGFLLYLSGSERRSTLNSSPPSCCLPFCSLCYSSLPQGSHYGRFTGHEDWAYLRMRWAKEGDEPYV